MTQLNDMALFVEVVKAMSFRRAAEVSGVPSSTLSRKINNLEQTLGLRLLHRTTRKIELTEAGQLYFERCKRIVEEARLANEQLRDMLAQPCGVLRASLPADFANIYLAPLLTEFAALYPGISFDLDLTPRNVDLVTEPFDVAIRMGPEELPDSNLIARQLASLPSNLYASPRYLKQAGVPQHPSEMSEHKCIRFRKGSMWTLKSKDEAVEVNVSSRFTVNGAGMMRRLATLDGGIILVPEAMVADDLANGSLQPVLPEWQGEPISVYALTATRLLPAKTQRFIDFLRERLSSCAKNCRDINSPPQQVLSRN